MSNVQNEKCFRFSRPNAEVRGELRDRLAGGAWQYIYRYTVNHEYSCMYLIHAYSCMYLIHAYSCESSEHAQIKSHKIFPLLTNNTPVLQIHMK